MAGYQADPIKFRGYVIFCGDHRNKPDYYRIGIKAEGHEEAIFCNLKKDFDLPPKGSTLEGVINVWHNTDYGTETYTLGNYRKVSDPSPKSNGKGKWGGKWGGKSGGKWGGANSDTLPPRFQQFVQNGLVTLKITPDDSYEYIKERCEQFYYIFRELEKLDADYKQHERVFEKSSEEEEQQYDRRSLEATGGSRNPQLENEEEFPGFAEELDDSIPF